MGNKVTTTSGGGGRENKNLNHAIPDQYETFGVLLQMPSLTEDGLTLWMAGQRNCKRRYGRKGTNHVD